MVGDRSTTACDRGSERRVNEGLAFVVDETRADSPHCRRWLPTHQRPGTDAAMAGRGRGILRRRSRVRPPADHGVLAWTHPVGHLVLPAARHRGDHERELRRGVDRAHYRAVWFRHRARIVIARRTESHAAAGARHGEGEAGSVYAGRTAWARARRA